MNAKARAAVGMGRNAVRVRARPFVRESGTASMIDKPAYQAYVRMMRRLKHNVRTFRRALNLTVKAAAARAHVHWRYWQKIEAGEVNATLAKMTHMANALGVEPQHLLLPRSSLERERLLREAMKHAAKAGKGRGR